MNEPPETRGEEIEADRPLPGYYRVSKNGSGAVTVLSAAMLAVGEILEPAKANVEIEHVVDDSLDDDRISLDFGDLPSLD
jgi:hypothetical protein